MNRWPSSDTFSLLGSVIAWTLLATFAAYLTLHTIAFVLR